jgi:hypothetical protein
VRAVWWQDVDTAKTILAARSAANTLIKVVKDGVQLCNPAKFAADFAAGKVHEFVEPSMAGKQTEKKGARRSPFKKALVLTGLLDLAGQLCHTAESNLKLLAREWTPTLSAKPINRTLAEAVAAEWIEPMIVTGTSPPDLEDFTRAASLARASSQGPDGIPFVAWAAAGSLGGQTFAELEMLARCEQPIPAHYNPEDVGGGGCEGHGQARVIKLA